VTGLELDSGFDLRVALGQPEAAIVVFDNAWPISLTSASTAGPSNPAEAPRDHRLLAQPAGGDDHPPARDALRGGCLQCQGERQRSEPRSALELSGGSQVAADLGLGRADATLSGASRLQLAGTASHDPALDGGSRERRDKTSSAGHSGPKAQLVQHIVEVPEEDMMRARGDLWRAVRWPLLVLAVAGLGIGIAAALDRTAAREWALTIGGPALAVLLPVGLGWLLVAVIRYVVQHRGGGAASP
jgi:hypothetical protein